MTVLTFSSDAEKRDAGWALANERGQVIAELCAVLHLVLNEYAVFRSKPLGAPGSYVRERQDRQIALEDRIRRAISRGSKP